LAWLEKQNLRLRNPREVGWDRLFATLLFSDCNTLPIFRQHSEFLQNACPELLRTEVKIPSRLFIPRPRRLRLGVALNRCSDGLTSSAVSRLFRQLDRDRFETVLFFPDNSPANESFASMLAAVDESHAVPSALDREEWRETNLVAARAGLDLLLHENWGIYSFISFSRLAPVQCSFFDTCISIAAPAEDYVVLAGKPDWLADWKSWYAEKIVLLDNFVGGWGKPGPDEPEAVHLEEFGLPSTAKLMFTWHDPRRWDPGDDALLAKLLSDNPAAWLLVAASHHPPTVRQGLAIRWRLSLAAAYERIKFIPFQPPGRFLGLLRRADLVLTPPVAGTMSTGTALGQGVSLVVRDGQSPNIKINTLAYEILGVEGLIARSPEEWLALNQRLLDDRDWRRKKGEEIRANYPKLHDQAAAVRDLENFLEAAYERARNGLPPAAWSGGRFLDG
jgi:predicted O-linked N-acetylglucosamine transferase (SPINDLY family)